MKALVTGGAGFIGSHLCDRLIRDGWEVTCYDNLSTGKRENVQHLIGDENFTLHIADIRNTHQLNNAMQGVDVVFNQMASKKTICEKDPIEDCEINAGGTLNVLLAMVRNDVKKIVHASTGSVYGEHPNVITEFSTLDPVSYYGVSKLAGEKYVAAFADMHGIEYTILRYFHVYGARQDSSDKGGVVPIFITKMLNKEPIQVHGDGEQVRSFTYVEDVVEANICGAWEMTNSIYNCASGLKVSINQLVDQLEEMLDYCEVETTDELLGDVRNFDIDNTLIKEDYKIEFTDFKTGLRETVDFYAEIRDN